MLRMPSFTSSTTLSTERHPSSRLPQSFDDNFSNALFSPSTLYSPPLMPGRKRVATCSQSALEIASYALCMAEEFIRGTASCMFATEITLDDRRGSKSADTQEGQAKQ